KDREWHLGRSHDCDGLPARGSESGQRCRRNGPRFEVGAAAPSAVRHGGGERAGVRRRSRPTSAVKSRARSSVRRLQRAIVQAALHVLNDAAQLLVI
ncbi:hypothetical protein BRADI_2g34623v3, partial [Brachypodium distachyon]